MRHPDDVRLNDYVDGRLDAESGTDVETHLGECDECRDRVQALRELDVRLRSLPTGIRPRRDLRPPRPEAAGPSTWLQLVVAVRHGPWLRAAALVAVLAAVTVNAWLGIVRTDPSPPPDRIASSVAASYARAGDDLTTLLDARRARLDPAVARAVETSLTAVEAAIRELEDADAAGEEAVELARQLEARHRMRLELLRGALDLLEGS